jgi:hypothetical protein
MAFIESLTDLILESEWCCEFREEMALDPSFAGCLRAVGRVAAHFVGTLIMVGAGLAILAYFIFHFPG